MQGLVKEGEEIMDEDFEGEVMDAPSHLGSAARGALRDRRLRLP